MKYCILGSGGVGGYFGARLAADGNDVIFVARGPHRAAMEAEGLKVTSQLGDIHIAKPVLYDNPGQAGHCDFVLLCTKLWDTEDAIEIIRPLLGQDSAVLSLQNGVMAEDLLAERLGSQHVLGATCGVSAHIKSPGVIEHVGPMSRINLSELDGRSSTRQDHFQAAGERAGIQTRVHKDIKTEIWSKFSLLTPFAGAACLHRAPMGELLARDEARATLTALLEECIAIARTEGANFAADFQDNALARYGTYPATMKPSMLVDLDAGRRLELPWLSGEVVKRGERLGIDTPANRAVLENLLPLAEGRV